MTQATLSIVDGGIGFDHNFCIKNENSETMVPVAKVVSSKTGRVLELSATQPGVQLYTGHFLGGREGKCGVKYDKYTAFCLETQHFPDSPNRPEFPSAVLKSGQTYNHTATFTFSTI